MLFRREEAEVIDTWHVSGLRGTGSHDMAVSSLRVPKSTLGVRHHRPPQGNGSLDAFPVFGLLAIAIAAVTLGTARAALADVMDLAGAKTPTTVSTRRLAERPATQTDLARATATLDAGRALLMDAIDGCWAAATSGQGLSLALRARLRRAATHAVECASRALDSAWTLAGGSPSTPPAHSSAASAICTRPPSTCSSRRPPGSSPVACCWASRSTPPSSRQMELDFLYAPSEDVAADVEQFTALGAELVFAIEAFDTRVAMVKFGERPPALLFAGHLDGERPILVYRVENLDSAVEAFGAEGHRIEIPFGPAFTFTTPAGQRLALYELTRPEMTERFSGRRDF